MNATRINVLEAKQEGHREEAASSIVVRRASRQQGTLAPTCCFSWLASASAAARPLCSSLHLQDT